MVPLERVYFLNDGESLDIGDRTVTAIRPPLYDSSATRGLWDPKTETYFAADCFGAALRDPTMFSDELDASEAAWRSSIQGGGDDRFGTVASPLARIPFP